MKLPSISICIPTINRAEILDSTLSFHISYTKDLNIPYIISDNCSEDSTELVGKTYEKKYDFVRYYRQKQNIRDNNFPFVLRQSITNYAWLLPDKHRISKKGFQRMLEVVDQNDYDLIVTNHGLRVKNIETQVYTDAVKLMEEIGWHMTDIAVLVFSKQFIQEVPFEKYKGTNFMHVGGIFSALAKRESFKVLWLNENMFERLAYKKIPGGWRPRIFEVWIESWCSAILSLPLKHYPLEAKVKCIRDHNINTGLFKKRKVLKYRLKGIYTREKYHKYKHLFSLSTNTSKWFFKMVLLFPIFKSKN